MGHDEKETTGVGRWTKRRSIMTVSTKSTTDSDRILHPTKPPFHLATNIHDWIGASLFVSGAFNSGGSWSKTIHAKKSAAQADRI
jgi:hypothetical protein